MHPVQGPHLPDSLLARVIGENFAHDLYAKPFCSKPHTKQYFSMKRGKLIMYTHTHTSASSAKEYRKKTHVGKAAIL